MKLGIVGTNFISDWFIEAAGNVPEVTILAVYSRKQETGDQFADKHQIQNVYTDYEKFLQSDIDAVYIATPTYAHYGQAIKAMKLKKHVLCEKILAVNERETSEMFLCADENNVILLEAMRPDFDPAFGIVKEHLPKIGKLRRATFEFCQYSSRYDKFREGNILNAFDPDLSNAAIMDIGVYCIHTLMQLFGMPKEIKSFSTELKNGFEGSGAVIMQYTDMIAEAIYSKITDSVNPSILMGEEGSILVHGVAMTKAIEIIFRDGRREQIPYSPSGNNMEYEIREFIRLINQSNSKHPFRQYSLNTARVIDEVRRQNGIVFDADSVV